MKALATILILTLLFAMAAVDGVHMNRPPLDPCRKGLLDHCKADADCKLNAHQLHLWTQRQETLKEICVID